MHRERPTPERSSRRRSVRGKSAARRGVLLGPERERERERDVSALLTHLPTGALGRTPTLITSVPNGLTRKQPLFIRSGPLPNNPLQALKPVQKTDPNPIYRAPTTHSGKSWTTKNITPNHRLVKNETTTHPQHHADNMPHNGSAVRKTVARLTRMVIDASCEFFGAQEEHGGADPDALGEHA